MDRLCIRPEFSIVSMRLLSSLILRKKTDGVSDAAKEFLRDAGYDQVMGVRPPVELSSNKSVTR